MIMIKIFLWVLLLFEGSSGAKGHPTKEKDAEPDNFYYPVTFDTLIVNGTIIDTERKTSFRGNIGISDGKISLVSQEPIDPKQSQNVIDAEGQLVTPGLIDLHTHIYWGSTYWGLKPDPIASITGVTTWVDAGSSGAYNFPGFLEGVVKQSQVKVYSFLHVSGIGLTGRTFESGFSEFLDMEMSNATILANPEIIRGIKVRVDKDAAGGSTQPLEKARELSRMTGLPLMVHIAKGPPSLEEIVNLLESGDILTHALTGHDHKLVDDNGQPLTAIINSLKSKGVILDVGHGTGSFSYKSAEGLMANGIYPDVISSDLHQVSRMGPMFDLPTTLSKFLNLGMSLEDVIARATIAPAGILGVNSGVIKEGVDADIAIFDLKEGDFTFKDSMGEMRNGKFLLENKITMVNGEIMLRSKENPPHPWVLRDMEDIAGFFGRKEEL